MSESTGNWDSNLVTSADNREYPRLPVWGDATFRRADVPQAPRIPVTLIDISHGGICFASEHELVVGQHIVLEMEPPEGAIRSLKLAAEVRWTVTDIDCCDFRVGCSWTQPLSMDDLLQFC